MPQRTAQAAGLLPGPRSGGPHRAGRGAAIVLYVSPSGSDANPGTLALPLATLDVARRRVRTLPRGAPLTVYLRGGRYQVQAPVAFDLLDSGTPGGPVTYAAYPGEVPVLSGGTLVAGWVQVDTVRHVWQAPLPAGLGLPRTMFMNGVRYTRPRHPTSTTNGVNYNATTGVANTNSTVDWTQYRNLLDMELISAGSFTESRLPVTGTGVGSVTTLTTTSQAGAIIVGESGAGNTCQVENVFEFLGIGQFYVDRTARTISCIPLPGVIPSAAVCMVVGGMVQTLVNVLGTSGAPVHDLTFSGIQFSETGFTMDPLLGYICIQGGVQSLQPPALQPPYGLTPAAFQALYATRVTLTRCTFARLGHHGARFTLGCTDCSVTGTLFADISGVGLYLGWPNVATAERDRPTRLTVKNNVLRNVGMEFGRCPALQQFGTSDTEIAYNTISDTPWSGLCAGWGWGNQIFPFQTNLRIHHNLVHRVMQKGRDGGCLYSNGRSTGEIITDNALYEAASDFGLYFDDGSLGKLASRNALFGTPAARIFINDPAGVNYAFGNVLDSLQISIANGGQTPPGTTQVVTPQTIVPVTDLAITAIVAAAGVQPAYIGLLTKGAAL